MHSISPSLARPHPVVLPIKLGVDIALILLTAPFWMPLLLIIAAMVAAQGGPVFFSQTRIGQNGHPFRIWKFRTMRASAEGRLAELLQDPAFREEWKRHGKLLNDPRQTWFGGILRRHSLDELPQIWNVLRGEMSLVGPRPLLPEELRHEYGTFATAVLRVRPGMTGAWQVSGRNLLSYAERLELDLNYARNPSFTKDLAILARTVQAILRGTGH